MKLYMAEMKEDGTPMQGLFSRKTLQIYLQFHIIIASSEGVVFTVWY